MIIYTVWSRDEYEPDLFAIFTNERAANEYAEQNRGRVFKDIAFDTVEEEAAFEGFED